MVLGVLVVVALRLALRVMLMVAAVLLAHWVSKVGRGPLDGVGRSRVRGWAAQVSLPRRCRRSRRMEMALTTQTMTDEQRKSVAIEYLKAFDNAGTTTSGGSILDLFADDAQVYFPKWGIATGREEIGRLFGDVGATIGSITHHFSEFNWVFSGSDVLVCEGTSHGEHRDGPWRAGVPEWGAGRWCDVFEIRDWKIQRVFIYLDPDYAGKDVERYPWLGS
jgi:hypothetical protein